MKKILLIIALALAVLAPLSADWFEPIMIVNMGYNIGDDIELVIDGNQYAFVDTLPPQTISFDITTGAVLFEFLWLEGQFITYTTLLDMSPIGGMFTPYQMEYGFRAGLQWAGLRIGYEHWCYHPVKTLGEYPVQRFGGVDRVFLEFDIQRLRLQQATRKKK